jgi:hypothetical protein
LSDILSVSQSPKAEPPLTCLPASSPRKSGERRAAATLATPLPVVTGRG